MTAPQSLRLTPLRCIAGVGGSVLHGIKCSSEGFAGFGEAYFSEILPGAIKSWRRHTRVTSNLVVPVGAVRFVFHAGDGRGFQEHVIGREADFSRLTVPPNWWMAFQGASKAASLILNVSSGEHDPGESETAELNAFPFAW